jgi:DNA-binding CsgD family transcriptional regulator/tetratricopeptide (TPR) repeat protein
MVVSGPAGIGKTRLLSELADAASRAGWTVERLFGSLATRAMPFGAVSHLLPDEPSDDGSDLFRAVRSRLRRRAGDGPLLLVVDDGHLLDDGSATLVRHVAVRRDVKVVLGQRAGEIPSHEVVSLWKDGHAERMELQPLSHAETDRLVEEVLGGPGTVQLREAVWQLTLGHPLFVVTALEAAKETGAVATQDGEWRLTGPLARSEPLNDLVLSRLRGLDDAAAEAFQTVAIAEPIPESVLLSVVSEGSLSRLHDRGLLSVSDTGGERRISTPHPIYAEIILQTLASDRRRSLAARVADAVLERPRLMAGDRLHAALWMLDAGRTLDFDLALDASKEAMIRLDHQTAERLARETVAARPSDARACVALGQALAYAGRGDEADEVMRRAEPVDEEERALVAFRHSHALAFVCGRPEEGAALLREAARHVGDVRRLQLDVERAMYEAIAGDFAATFATAEAALSDPGLPDRSRVRVLVNLNAARAMTGRLEGFDEEADTALALCRQHSDQPMSDPDQLLQNRTLAWAVAGRLADANRLLSERVSEDERSADSNPMMLSRLGVIVGLRGDLRAAIAASSRALALAERWDPYRIHLQMVGHLVTHQGQAGMVGADAPAMLERAAEEAGDETRPSVWIGRGRAWLAVATGDLARAAEIARDAGRHAVERDHNSWGVIALYDAVRFGIPNLVAGDLVKAVEATTGCALLEAMRDHAVALAAGDPVAVEGVARRFPSMGSAILAAEAAAQAARLSSEHGDTAAATRAALFADVWRQRCTSVATPALADLPTVLTDREREVAELATTGLSSRELADRLVVSVRTVDNHLRAVYRKLQIGSREALASALAPVPMGNE